MHETSPRTPRFYFPGNLSRGATCELRNHAAHHAARVLRLAPGDAVALFNGDGTEWEASIALIGKSGVTVRLLRCLTRDVEAPLPIALVQGISSRERMDFTLQKATELGVAEIWPVISRRSVVRLREERASRRVEHWQNLIIAACEQCGRSRVPQVHPLQQFTDWLGELPKHDAGARLLLSPGVERRLRDLERPERVLLLVGPEGGLAPEEQDWARSCSFLGVRLGPRVLRTETAALAALSAMHALWGDF